MTLQILQDNPPISIQVLNENVSEDMQHGQIIENQIQIINPFI